MARASAGTRARRKESVYISGNAVRCSEATCLVIPFNVAGDLYRACMYECIF